jgi:probable phosphoglycerate mutase
LVRHGESTWNRLGLVQGQLDGASLTTKGRQQALALAERFRDGQVEALYTSDLRRARQTMEPLASALGLPVVSDRSLRERCFGTCEGGPVDALHAGITGIRGSGVVDAQARPPGGESLEDVQNRVGRFVEGLAAENHAGDVVVVAHGGSLRALRNYCAGLAVADMTWDVVPNASVWPVSLPATLLTAAVAAVKAENEGMQ